MGVFNFQGSWGPIGEAEEVAGERGKVLSDKRVGGGTGWDGEGFSGGGEKRGGCLAEDVYKFNKQRERGRFYGYERL